MKIAIFSKPYWPSVGGVEVTSRVMARLFQARGHKVTLLTETPLNGRVELEEGYSVCREVGFLNLRKQAIDSDVVVIKGGLSVPVALAAWLSGTPYVVWHEMAGSGKHPLASVKGKLRQLMVPFLTNRAVSHVGVSLACLSSKELPTGTRTAVVWNSVAPEFEQMAGALPPPNLQPVIDVLFVGRFIEGKGIFDLADALTLLANAGLPLAACFVGCGPDEEVLRHKLSNVPNLTVEFPGVLDAIHLSRVYPRARCLVLPSTSHPEGMPLVVGEAFMFGVPVIGSDQPAIVETVGDAGSIFKQGSSKELAARLQRLLENEDVQIDYKKRARKRASFFSSERFIAEAEGVIGEALGAD